MTGSAVLWGGQAVGALRLGLLEGHERGLERFGLGGIGGHRIHEDAVLFALEVLLVLVLLDWGGRGRHHRIGDAFGQDVEAQHGEHDCQTREERLPPEPVDDAFLRGGEDVTPGGRGLRNAGVDE